MLLRLKVCNFLSFYEENIFDMFPNPQRTTFQNHVYKDLKIPLLKQAALYGANGSGKSNLLHVMRFIKEFAVNKDGAKKFVPRLYKFRLIENNNAPIRISVEFLQEDTYFIYDLVLNDTQIEKEELLISGLGEKENELLYRRCGKEIQESKTTGKELKQAIGKMLESNPLASVLSLNKEFPVLKDERVEVAYNWFNDNLQILSLHRLVTKIINLMADRPDFLAYTNRIISNIGLGIESIDIQTEKLIDFFMENSDNAEKIQKMFEEADEKLVVSKRKNDRILFAVEKEKGEAIVRRFIFKQLGLGGYAGELEYERQSDGTVRLINLLPALYGIKNNPRVYFIDELECGIHPTLIFELMKFFGKEETKGQLIYTTHAIMLLNQQELMRPDEVWFVEKHQGNSRLYSLNDFKEHNTINIINGYLEGRYGAIPFIGNLGENRNDGIGE